jgi:sulfatase maturation enzyme AslB (radical SAM superfamily)
MPLYARAAARYMPHCWGDAAGFADRRFFNVIAMPEAARPVLMGLDGASDFESYAFTSSHRAILRELIRQGYAEECAPDAPLSTFQRPRRSSGPYLREVHWAITGRCNLRCRHCFMESPINRYPEPSLAELERTVDHLHARTRRSSRSRAANRFCTRISAA